jgi:putative tryptophan/tyrosine transport system substrate-binding protein
MPVIGVLTSTSFGPPGQNGTAFLLGLRETGYVEGQTVAIEYHRAEGSYDRLAALAADLVSRKVDLIVTADGTPEALAARSATSTIPIVFNGVADPVGAGLVTSLARPGGNLTGFSPMNIELMAKRFELLSELVPQVKVIALLVNPNNQTTEAVIRAVQEAARVNGVQLPILKASTEGEIDAAFATLVELRAGGLVVGSDSFLSDHGKKLSALALHYVVPVIDQGRGFAASGGLISYGRNIADSYRQTGVYAGRILKGAKPADLPVEQPTTFELVVNLKTAQALGLTVPPLLLAQATEVIE